jgi:hypothetical protein
MSLRLQGWSISNEAISLAHDFLRIVRNDFLAIICHILYTSVSVSIFISAAHLAHTLAILRLNRDWVSSLRSGLIHIWNHAVIQTHLVILIHRVKWRCYNSKKVGYFTSVRV